MKYNTKIINSEVQIFLGAGASKCLGKWLMNEFIDKLLLQLNEDERKILDTIIKYKENDLEIVLQELNSLIDKNYLSDLKKRNELMYLLDYTGELAKRNAYIEGTHRNSHFTPLEVAKSFNSLIEKCNGIKIKIENLIFEHYGEVNSNLVAKLYMPIFNFLKKQYGLITIPIFTTNYDNVIEKLDESEKYKIIDGFEIQQTKKFIWKRKIFDNFKPKKDNINIPLFKLHGSVTWYKKDGEILYLEIPFNTRKNKNINNELIFPTQNKICIEDPFYSAYEYFHRCIDKSKLLIVIGYSFRDYDTLTKIKSSLDYNDNLKIIIFDAKAEEYKKKIFNNNSKVIAINSNFDFTNLSVLLKKIKI